MEKESFIEMVKACKENLEHRKVSLDWVRIKMTNARVDLMEGEMTLNWVIDQLDSAKEEVEQIEKMSEKIIKAAELREAELREEVEQLKAMLEQLQKKD